MITNARQLRSRAERTKYRLSQPRGVRNQTLTKKEGGNGKPPSNPRRLGSKRVGRNRDGLVSIFSPLPLFPIRGSRHWEGKGGGHKNKSSSMTLDINTQVRKMLVELGDKTFKCWTKGLGSKRIYAGVTGEIYLR